MFKNQTKLAIALLALTQLPAVASAAGDNFGKGYPGTSYAGLNGLFTSYSDDTLNNVDLNVLSAKFGFFMSEYISAEVRAGFGMSDDSVQGVDFETDHMFGAYVRGGFPVANAFYPYAVAGMTRAKYTLSNGSINASTTENDFSYGFGADFNVTPFFTINGEWMSFIDKEGGEVDGFSLGVATQF